MGCTSRSGNLVRRATYSPPCSLARSATRCGAVWLLERFGSAVGGTLVTSAMLRGQGDYMDWSCSTGEGLVDEQVLAEMRTLGWESAETKAREL